MLSQISASLLAVLLLSTWLTPTQPARLLTVSTSSWKPSLIALDTLPVRAVRKVPSLLFPEHLVLVLSQHLHIDVIISDLSVFATDDRVYLQHLYSPQPIIVAQLTYRSWGWILSLVITLLEHFFFEV